MIKQTKNAISFLNKAYRAIYAHAYLKGLANSLALISCVAVAPCANAVVSEQCTLSEDGNTYTCTSVKDTSSITAFKDFNSEVSGKELEVKDSTLSDVVTSSSGITANNNKLTVSNSTITEYGTVAGKADNIKYLSDGTREILNNDVTANNNTLIIKDKSDVTGAVQAGHAYAVSSNEVLKATANDNKIEVSDSNISESFVIGGYASSNQAVAKLNKVTFNNVNLTDGRVTGGQASYANENTVEIADSTITDPVFGTVTGGWATTEANDNEVNVKNLTIKGVSEEGGGQIIGGFASGKANNNTVNINGGSAIVKTNYEAVAGGYADFEASGNTVKIENFDTVNEDSPSYTGNIFGGHVSQEGSVANNNQVTISDSNVGRVYGGAYSRAESSGNTVTIENSSVRDHVVGGSSWASRAYGEHGNAGVAKNNKVYFNNSTFNGSMYQTGLQGAGAGNEATGNLVSLKNSKILLLTEDAKNSAQTQGATGRVNASNNTLSITDNSLVEGGQVEAAMTYANYDYQNEDRTASSNKLIIKDSTVNGKARGGVTWVNAQIADFWPENGNPGRLYTVGLKSTLQGNSAEIVNSSVDLVYAAEFQADWVGEDADTRDFSGVVLDGNTVTIDGKSNIKGDAIAATAVSSHYENNNDKDFLFYQYQGTATKNVLNVNGGTIGGNAIAARADVANNNTVNILGGTFLGHVYAVNAKTEAKGNTVNIGADGKATNDLDLSKATISAFDKTASDLDHSNNTLNVYTKDLVANNVEGFDNYNFYLPSGIANGDKILTLTDENGTDVSNSTIGVTLQSGAALNPDDKISLITNANGLKTDGITGGLHASTADGTTTKKFLLTTDENTVYATYGGKTVVTGDVDKDVISSEKPEGGDITSDELEVDNAKITGSVTVAKPPNGNVTGASVSITDSKVEKDVIAGQAGEGTVEKSKVEIGGDDTVILGTVSAGKVDEGKVTQAKVTLAGGTVNVIKGGFAKAGEAVANVVDLIKGEVDTVFGGNVESGGKSEGNIVNLLGAKVKYIYGGACDTAEGNITNLTKGIVDVAVYAGQGEKKNINNVINIGSENQSDLSKLDLTAATLYGGKQGNDVKNEGNTLNVYGKTSAKGVVDFDNYNFYNVEKNSTAHLALTDNVDLTDSKITVELAKDTNLTVGDTVNLISTQGTLTADNAAIDAGLKAKSGAVLEYSFGLDNVNNNSLVATAKTAEASGTLQDLSLSQLSGLLATKQTTEMVAYKGIPVARDVLASSKANDTFSVAPFVVASYGNNEYGDGETVKVKGADFIIGLALGINTGAGDITLGAYYDNHTGDHDTSSHFGSADGDNSSNGAGLLARFDAVQLGVGNPYAEATFRFGKMDTDTKSSSICDTQGRTLNVSNDADYVAGHFGIGYDMKFDKLGADVYAKYFFTKLDGVDVDVLGDTVKLDSVSSKTLRLGTNLSYALDSGLTPYFGLAYENESDAKAEGTVLGYKLKNTDVKSSSGLVSVGAQFTPTSAQGFSLDASLDGYFGNRQGVIGNIQASYKF